MISEKHFYFLSYLLECLLGTAIGYFLYKIHPIVGAWSLFSIILVLSPDRKDAMNLAVIRIKANLIGAAVGLIIFWVHPINLFMVSLGIVLTLIACELLKLQVASRTAMISVLIITLHEPGQHFWDIALERAGGVFAGCMIGVVLTYIFHVLLQSSRFFKIKKP